MVDRNKIIEIFKASPTPTSILKPSEDKFIFIQVNDAYCEMTQMSADNLIGYGLFEKFPPNPNEDLPHGPSRLKQSFLKVIDSKQPDEMSVIRYDIMLDGSEFKEVFWKVINTPVFDDNGEVEYIINSATPKTEQVLSERARNLMLNNTEDSFIYLNRDLVIIDFNTKFFITYKDIFGKEVKKGNSIWLHVSEERNTDLKELYERVLTGETITNETSFDDPQEGKRHFQIKNKPAIDNGTIVGVFISMLEITERVEAEKSIIDAKEKYESLISTVNGIIWEAEPEHLQISFISDQCRHYLGYAPEEWVNTKNFWSKRLHPEDKERVLKKYHTEVKNGRNHELNYRLRHASGHYIWIRDLITVVTEHGEPSVIRGLMMDVTEEMKLQENLSEAYKISKIGNWELDLINKKLLWSDYVKELHEVGKNFVPNLDSAINFYKKGWCRDKIVEAVQTAIEVGTPFDEELIIVTAKGNEKWIRAVGKAEFVHDECVRIYGSTQDITERKKAELELKKTNQALTERVKEQKCLYKISNLDENSLTIEALLERAAKIIPKGFYLPDKAQAQINFMNEVYRTVPFNESWSKQRISESASRNDVQLTITAGYPKVVSSSDVKILEEEKTLLKAISQQLIQKVNQIRKQNELNAIQQKYKNVVEYTTNMFYQHDTEGVLTYVSPQSSWFLGYPPDKARKNWQNFITENPLNDIGKTLTQKALETGKIQEPYELELKTADGRIIWVEVHEAPIKKDGKVIGIVGSLTDITDRKNIETDLKNSLERFEYVKKATRDAIYDWDIKNDKLNWGDGLQYLFGHDPVKNNRIDQWKQFVHPDDFEEVIRDLKFTLNDPSMSQWSSEYRFKKENGGYANVIENGTIVRNEDGDAVRMIGAVRDISDQKLTEKELKASLSEKETLLAEIHHRVKNNLAVVSGMMQLQAFETDNKVLQEQLYDSVVRIKTMASVHELLYQSNSFSQLDFSETLKQLVKNVTDTLQSENKVEIEYHAVPVKLNINQAIPASLIVNEVITNAFKHAFKNIDDSKLTINLSEEDDQLEISIIDNGVGIPEDIQNAKDSSLGFHLIELLSEQLYADKVYKKNPDVSGTIFKLSFIRQANKKGIGSSSVT